MGRYQSIYAGPVLLCRHETIQKQQRFPRCENTQCRVFHKRAVRDTPKCLQCGQDMGQEVATFEAPSVDANDIAEALLSVGREDALEFIHEDWCSEVLDGHHIFIPGHHNTEPPREFHNSDDACCIMHSHIDFDAEKGWMAENYKDVIEALKKLYVNVWVDWSFLVYSN